MHPNKIDALFPLVWIDPKAITSVQDLAKRLQGVSDAYVVLCPSGLLENLDLSKLQSELLATDILHGGYDTTSAEPLDRLQLLTFNWLFLNPQKKVRSNNWKASSDFVVFHVSLLSLVGGIDIGYQSLNAALLDFSYRALMLGARVICAPEYRLASLLPSDIGTSDELRFVAKHFPAQVLAYYKLLRGCLFYSSTQVPLVPSGNTAFRLVGSKRRSIENYTAIIPTINRYDYLKGAIHSLLSSDFVPGEIIVVDQTPIPKRIDGYYDEFQRDARVRIVFLDQAGQALSRNVGIDEARHDWIYLFDDDSLCWKQCTAEHRYLLEHSHADVSTGLSLAPWKDVSYIKGNIAYYRIADVLDTGNCFISKATLQKIGKIDMAFNKGPGADDDLGKRLFLSGYEIYLNPKAIRTHYKAKTGGLREHGAWWRNTSKLLEAYPPPTQLYMIRKYYNREKWFAQILLSYFLSRKKITFLRFLLNLFLAPLKYLKSFQKVKVLESQT